MTLLQQLIEITRTSVGRTRKSPGVRAIAGSLGAAVLGQLFLLVSGSLAARLLGPEDRGYAALIALVPSVICVAGGLGLSVALTYFIARRPGSAAAFARAIRMPALVQTGSLTLIHAGVMLWILTGTPGHVTLPVAVSLIAVPSSFATEYGLAILQGEQRYSTFNVLRIAPLGAYAVALGVLAVAGGATLFTITFVATSAAASAGLGTLLYVLRTGAATRQDLGVNRAPFRSFALRSYLGQLAPIESFRLDQIYVASFLGPVALGLYAVATAFTNLPRFIGRSIAYIAAPYLSAAVQDRQRRLFRLFTAAGVILCGGAALSTALAAPFLVPLFFGEEFRSAIRATQILVAGGFLLGVRGILVASMRGLGFPTAGSIAEAVSLVWFLAALPLVANTIEGAALAFATSAAVGIVALVLAYAFAARQRRAQDDIA